MSRSDLIGYETSGGEHYCLGCVGPTADLIPVYEVGEIVACVDCGSWLYHEDDEAFVAPAAVSGGGDQ